MCKRRARKDVYALNPNLYIYIIYVCMYFSIYICTYVMYIYIHEMLECDAQDLSTFELLRIPFEHVLRKLSASEDAGLGKHNRTTLQ